MRFELTRALPNGLAGHRLNHSATLSYDFFALNIFNLVFLRLETEGGNKKDLEEMGIDPITSRMLSARSTIWATPPIFALQNLVI